VIGTLDRKITISKNTSKTPLSLAAILFLGLVLLFGSFCGPSRSELIPLEVLLGNPEKSYPQISPDGTMMAYIAPVDNVLNVWVKTIGTEDDRPVTKDENRGIRRYFWAGGNRHIMYLQDLGWKENWRLYSVDLKTGGISDLTPFEDVQVPRRLPSRHRLRRTHHGCKESRQCSRVGH